MNRLTYGMSPSQLHKDRQAVFHLMALLTAKMEEAMRKQEGN